MTADSLLSLSSLPALLGLGLLAATVFSTGHAAPPESRPGDRGLVRADPAAAAPALVVQFRPDASPGAIRSLERRLAVAIEDTGARSGLDRVLAGQGANLESLLAALRDSRGGRNLVELGYDADIVTSAKIDSLSVVPEVLRGDDGLRIVG